ncbi:hypothetical protein PsorP6_015700 [Peronosclerospora sorghi]|uniref:Uncharacterized protein n=1 Tax=Peronosclerospora sorghi TaxID=230839 RepID=A0ACC0WNZ9_9STRA|nr:hypothetical protein PsorP6_015700 [Peronosclerospora sorghi]
MKLAKDREHWTRSRANMKREDEMCLDEDVWYKQEHEYEQEWRVVQTQRITTAKALLEEHTARITRGTMRTEIFSDQLERQTKSKWMLLFKRGTLKDERKADCQLFSEHREDCKNTLDEARNKLTITPKYVARLEADMKVRASELQAVKDRNKRTPQEVGDAEVDERGEFMSDVRRRRAQFQKELDDQSAQIKAENKLCTSLVERMMHIKNLEDKVQNAAV